MSKIDIYGDVDKNKGFSPKTGGILFFEIALSKKNFFSKFFCKNGILDIFWTISWCDRYSSRHNPEKVPLPPTSILSSFIMNQWSEEMVLIPYILSPESFKVIFFMNILEEAHQLGLLLGKESVVIAKSHHRCPFIQTTSPINLLLILVYITTRNYRDYTVSS